MSRDNVLRGLLRALEDIGTYSRVVLGVPLRDYQLAPARAALSSIADQAGRSITILMPRQAGKNELTAQLEAYLLTRYSRRGGSFVKCAPTFKPQLVNSLNRVAQRLQNPLTAGLWRSSRGYQIVLGSAIGTYFSAQPTAAVVGATASLALLCDEAQDVPAEKWQKDFLPMGATGNATRIYTGTPWLDDDLLAQAIAEAQDAERRDGTPRHFAASWEDVAAANPAYGRFVEAEIARLGAHHPIIRTQYLLRTMGRAGAFLSADQLQSLQGDHQPEPAPRWDRPGHYVAALDVAGADEEDPDSEIARTNPRRDSTWLHVAWSEPARIEAGVLEPRLRIVRSWAWRGTPHRQLYPTILDILRRWRVARCAVDATGVGGGLAAYLSAALSPRVVLSFVYTRPSKSQLAYDTLAALNASRLAVYAESPADLEQTDLRRELLHQAAKARYAVFPGQVMLFSVPEQDGHDDALNALALLTQTVSLGPSRGAVGRAVQRRSSSLKA